MPDQRPFDIVFNVNEGGLPGFGATVKSMVEHCSAPADLRVHIMCSRLGESHKANIRTLFDGLAYRGEYRIIDYDADSTFQGLPGLLNDYTTYGRLLIPDYIDAAQILYLDSDLVITCDVLELADLDMEGYPIAAYTGTAVNYALDRTYFLERGYSKDMAYFNAGVLLMDLDAWRERDLTSEWKEIIADRPETLQSHDQTILNRICAGDFKRLPLKYNTLFLAHHKKPEHTSGIFHFVGSPKPWDVFGSVIHAGYPLWKRYSPPFWERTYQRMSLGRLNRAWSIRRSILRSIKKRYRR